MITNLYLSLCLNIKPLNMEVNIKNSTNSTLKIRYNKSSISIGNNINIKSKIYFFTFHTTLPLTYEKYNLGISTNKYFRKFNTKIYGIADINGKVNLSLYSFYKPNILNNKLKTYIFIKSNNFMISILSLGINTKIKDIYLSLNYSIPYNSLSFKAKYISKPLNISISFKEQIDIKASIYVDV